MLSNIKHRLFKTGNHINSRSVIITKYIRANKSENAFKVKRFKLNWCDACQEAHGYPEYDLQYKNVLMEVNEKHYIQLINQNKKNIITKEFDNGKMIITYC